jgi:ankyrin repeat protein
MMDFTPLISASCSGHFEIVQWLLSHGANPNKRYGKCDWASLHAAACCGQVEVSRLLLQYEADIYARDNNGRTTLHVAVQYDHVDVARFLLEHGADVNARDNWRNSPLLWAVKPWLFKRANLEVARLIVDNGANIDAEDDEGQTAFQVASDYGYDDIAKFLSNHGSK